MERSRPYAQYHIQWKKDQHLDQERTKVIDIISNVRKMKWSLARHINRVKHDRWTSRVTTWRPLCQENTTRETSQAVERRPGQILERHNLADDSTRLANLETACWGLRPTTAIQWWGMMMILEMSTDNSRFAVCYVELVIRLWECLMIPVLHIISNASSSEVDADLKREQNMELWSGYGVLGHTLPMTTNLLARQGLHFSPINGRRRRTRPKTTFTLGLYWK